MKVPLIVCLGPILFTNGAIGKQMIEKLNAQHIDVFQVFHRGYIDVLAFSDVQKHTINEEKESLDVEVLAP